MVRLRAVAAASVLCAAGSVCPAQILVYSNLATNQQQVVASDPLWDDAIVVGGGRLSGFSAVVYNAQAPTPRVYAGTVEIHLFDGANDRPDGPLLGSFPITSGTPMNPGESRLIARDDLFPLDIVVPAGARLGVLITFGPNFGVLLYDPPTVGASEDVYWRGVPPVANSTSRMDNFAIELRVPGPAAGGGLVWLGVALTARRRRRTNG